MRYINPHSGQPVVFPGGQQGNPQMVPMQGQYPQQFPQQQYPQQMVPMQGQYPMGGQMPQQGMYPQQFPGQMSQQFPTQMGYPQQFPTQQQFPQQFPPQGSNQSMVGQGRFGQSTTPQQQQFSEPSNNRYQTAAPEEPTVAEVSGKPEPFTVTPTAHRFLNNEKVVLRTITKEVTRAQVKTDPYYTISDGIDAIVESLAEDVYTAEHRPLVTVRNMIVENAYRGTALKAMVQELSADGVKGLYKLIKHKFPELTDKHQIVAISGLMQMLTDEINDYITVNAKNSISIDDFYTDFNDLLKVLRNNEEDLEDRLIEHLDRYLAAMRKALELLQSEEHVTHVPETFAVAYLDCHVLETGLEGVGSDFVALQHNAANVFLNSLAENITAVSEQESFLLVTMDKSIFKAMVGSDKTVYFRRFG